MAMTVSDVWSFMKNRRKQREQTDHEKYLHEIDTVDAALQKGLDPSLDALAIAAEKCGYDDKRVRDHLESLQRLRELTAKQAEDKLLADQIGPIDAKMKALSAEFFAFREKIFKEESVLREESQRAVSASARYYGAQSEVIDLEQKVDRLQRA